MKVPNDYRVRDHVLLGSDDSYGNNGCFLIPHYKIANYYFSCIASDGEGWEHVSITLIKRAETAKAFKKRSNQKAVLHGTFIHRQIIERNESVERCCTWEEMCYVKSLFFDEEESVMQLHPPKSMWVNNHPYCLHLWRPNDGCTLIPLPDKWMVGLASLNTTENTTA